MPKKNNLNVGILGYGEVGKAIAKFYKNPKIKDVNRDDGLEGVDVLHICIPWGKKFNNIVKKEVIRLRPRLVILHSTVAPGTTKTLGKDLQETINGMIVHSPIRGIHPYLYEGVKTFVKYIGADNKKAGEAAEEHLKHLGIKTRMVMPSVTTEAGKVLCTSYYGLCIAWHGEAKKMCDAYGADFEVAMTDFNKTYNDGYTKLGKKNVVRPVLFPPEGGIGGHCVISNAEILKKDFDSKALDLILDYEPKRSRIKK